MSERVQMLKEWVKHHTSTVQTDPEKEKTLADTLDSLGPVSDEVKLMATLVYVLGISQSTIATKLGISRSAVSAKLRPITAILNPAMAMMSERVQMLKEWVKHHTSKEQTDPDKEKTLSDTLASLGTVSEEVKLIATLVYVLGISQSTIATKLGISRTAVSAKLQPITDILNPAKPRGVIRDEILKAFPALTSEELTFAIKRIYNLKNHRYDPERSLSQSAAIQQVKSEVAAAMSVKQPYLGAPGVGVTASGKGVQYTVNGITGTPSELLRTVTGLPPSSPEFKRLYRKIYNDAQKKSMDAAVRDVIGRLSSAK